MADIKRWFSQGGTRSAVSSRSRSRFLEVLSKSLAFASALSGIGRFAAANSNAPHTQPKIVEPTADAAPAPIKRGSADYERASLDAMWNERKPDRYPDQIILGRSDSDVVAAVRLARANGWRIATRSGGHN